MNKKIALRFTPFFSLLLPTIQGTQLYVLFDIFNPILLIMPVVMGVILGFLVDLYRHKVSIHIEDLENHKKDLTQQIEKQTQELKKKNAELRESILLDPLTGLGNRLKLKESLKKESEKILNEYKYISLFMIDIDYFKKYNDFYGHLEGDKVLQNLARFLQETVGKEKNTVVRFGGEEFIVILPNTDKQEAIENAKKLVNGIESLNIAHEKSQVSNYVTISIGIHTTSNLTLQTKNDLLKSADNALYEAKERGRNRFYPL